MKIKHPALTIVSVVALLLAAYGVWQGGDKRSGESSISATPKESTYDRVTRTGKLRCAYVVYPPAIIADPTTGKLSGIIFDLMTEVGSLLDLEVQWTEEVGWGSTVETIKSGRADAICTSFWINPAEGKHLGFSIPLYYTALHPYVRYDDTRFDANPLLLNSANVRVSSGDGEMAMIIAKQDFPDAAIVALPNLTDVGQQMLDVVTNKADVTFIGSYTGAAFLANNPGKLKKLNPDEPIRLFANTVAIPIDDSAFKSMLDAALLQLLLSGHVDKTISRYEDHPNSFYRAASPHKRVH